MTTACIYLRLSAKSKGQKNVVNLDTQEADCRKLAADLGATVISVFSEYGQSAFDRDDADDRPQYAEMCDLVRRKEVDVVIAWHTDRLWRSDLEKALFVRDAQRAGLKLILTKTARVDPANPDDEFLLSILTAVARKESADKSRRIRSKMAANARAGKPAGTGNNRPFGFQLDRVTVIEHEAALIREMAKRLLDGETLNSVCRWVNASGVQAQNATPWYPIRLRDILVNPRYCGKRAVGQRAKAVVVADAVWPAILDPQTTDRLRALLLDPARRTNRSARSYLLSALVQCGQCGGRMVSHPRYNRTDADGAPKRDYACVNSPARETQCGRNSIQARELEVMIGAAVAARFTEMAAAGMFDPPADTVNDAISVEVAALDAKAAKLGSLWAGDQLADAAFHAAQAGLIERRSQLSAMVRRSVTTVPPVFSELAEHPERVAEEWDTFSFDRKRALITALVAEVVIGSNPVRGARRFNPDRLTEIRWRTRLEDSSVA